MTTPHKRNSALRSYQLKINGQMDAEFVSSFCPPETLVQSDGAITILANIHADQAGILGLVRHLHNLGCTILSMACE